MSGLETQFDVVVTSASIVIAGSPVINTDPDMNRIYSAVDHKLKYTTFLALSETEFL